MYRKSGFATARNPRRNPTTDNWRAVSGDLSTVIPPLASNADLAILSGNLALVDLVFAILLEPTLMESGNPSLILPKAEAQPENSFALIAWGGTTACVRAVSAWLFIGISPEDAVIRYFVNQRFESPKLGGIATV
jgi:hypothetical protein